jgi:hypothetical protein
MPLPKLNTHKEMKHLLDASMNHDPLTTAIAKVIIRHIVRKLRKTNEKD